jgi:iron(III) transport system substrate-binding protein
MATRTMIRSLQAVAATGLMLLTVACGEGHKNPPAKGRADTVTVFSTTDAAVFQPVIADFRAVRPDIRLDYIELDAQPLFEKFLADAASARPRVDIVLSSAVDLQVKLVNDGYGQKHVSDNADALPAWAKWRSEIFGLTFEPVVMVVNPTLFAGRTVPANRLALVQSLRADPAFWRRKIGTYDIAASSVGYLLAGQDARQSSEFGALVGAMGAAGVRTYPNVAVLIDDIATGKVALGYNVLGSYAKRQVDQGANLKIIYPEDYTLAVARAAFIARSAPNPKGAHAFLDYLMSLRGQRILATRSGLAAVREDVGQGAASLQISSEAVGPLRPIAIGPGLMTYLDRQKRERFLENWRTAIDDSAPQ